jgi:hypothetical protein
MIGILYLIGGILIGIVITWLFMFNAKKNFAKSLWEQRGTGKFGIIVPMNVYSQPMGAIEVEQLQEASEKTKVKIINIIAHKGKTKEALLEAIQCDSSTTETWLDTHRIKWYNNASQYVRDRRLGDILGKTETDGE